MSKFILIFCLLALAYSENGFDAVYVPETQPTDAAPVSENPSIMFNFIDSPVVDLVWCGTKKEVIFILTEKNSLYRSADDGFSGHKLTEHLQRLGKAELGGADTDVGTVARIIQSPTEKNMLIMQGTEAVNWITEDCGGGYRAMDQGRPVEEFLFHPTERNWLLASAWTKCEDFQAGEPCKKFKELFVSKNLGGTWELVASNVFQFSWGRVDNSFFRVPKERVIIAHQAKPTQKGMKYTETLQIAFSDDFFKTSNTTVLTRANKFLITSYFFFAVQYTSIDAQSQEITLLVGDPKAKTYTLRPIELPFKRLLEHSYTILDTAEHSVFLHVNHDGDKSTYGNIYVSDSTGVRYSSSITGNVINPDGQCDFERVQGVEGIYLANVIDAEARKRFKNLDLNEFPQQRAQGKANTPASKSPADEAQRVLHDFKKTMISFNKGSIWQQLTPPERDSQGKKIICTNEEDCFLHLHSISNTNFGPFYTTENSLGLILGTGNIGRYLSNKADEINTYLSRDGGLTWFEIAKGSHIYEIGDHGSIIVLAPDQHATKEVYYSWNEGLTWETLVISDVPIEVTNIIIEPSNTAEKFLIYGRESGQTKRGVMVAADFTPIHKRLCDGVNSPDTPESDYETWSPNGKISPHCLLGKQVTYTRRKREAECFNREDHDRWRFVHRCECTEDDWECDYGYMRVGSGPCLPMNEKMENQTTAAPDECDGHYFITQGYRKVGGNTCDGGITHDPIKIPCPRVITKETQNLVALLALSVVSLALIWKTSSSAALGKAKGCCESLKNMFKMPNFKKGEGKANGFQRLQEEPDTVRDEEDMFGRIEFEEGEERGETADETNAHEMSQGKKMTERRAIETANKRVPTLHKPGEKKGTVNLLE